MRETVVCTGACRQPSLACRNVLQTVRHVGGSTRRHRSVVRSSDVGTQKGRRSPLLRFWSATCRSVLERGNRFRATTGWGLTAWQRP